MAVSGFGAKIDDTSGSSSAPWICKARPDLDSEADVKSWSVGELRQFLRRSQVAKGVVMNKLEAAAVTTFVRHKTISAFRKCCFRMKEGHGRLYDLVKLLAPPPAKNAVDSNPYAEFKAKHPELSLPRELDFLLKGYLKKRMACSLDYDLGLNDEEADRLIEALRTELIPEWLLRPCSFLTFEENLDTRVQVVRLWMKSSKLPIYVGSSITFEELSSMTELPGEPAGFPLEENLPSMFLIRMREETLVGHHWSSKFGWHVTHPTPEQMPQNCIPYSRCYAKVRYPVLVKDPGCPPYSYITGDAETDQIEYDEDVEANLSAFVFTETPRMYKLLARLLFDRDDES